MDELARIKQLAGVNTFAGYRPYDGSNITITGNEKAQIMKENDIKPGTPEWFKLWFSKPYLTGEKPFDETVVEDATAGATSAGNIATVVSPHVAIGKDRGKKSYTGSPGKSGTKAPQVPKAAQAKNADGTAKNAQDLPNTSLFGGPGAIKR